MKTIFRTMMVAAAVFATVGCGNKTKDQAGVQAVAVDVVPSVSVQQVFVKAVPQEATYTSTIQPYIKNNIVPQTAGRITKINVEIGDKVRKGQVLVNPSLLYSAQYVFYRILFLLREAGINLRCL